MNILVTIPSFSGKGGVSSYYNSLLPFLADQMDCSISFLEIGNTRAFCKALHPIVDQLRFLRAISNNSFDLIHVNPSLDPKSLLRDGMFMCLAKRKRLPLLVFLRGWHADFEPLLEGSLGYFVKKNFSNADAFIVLASAFKEKLKKRGVRAPIYVETTAVDDTLLSDFSIQRKINIFRNVPKTKILFLARIEKEKGIFETLDALNILLKRGHTVSLTVAGDGSAMRKVTEYLLTCQLNSDKVKLLGYVRGDQKKEVFNSHHIYCFPSYGEGMPNSVLEAMAFGMPVVTRPVGGIKDFFENGKMGFLTKSTDPERIADLIEELIGNKEKMADMALYNHQYAKERFMASRVAKRLKRIYEMTVAENCG